MSGREKGDKYLSRKIFRVAWGEGGRGGNGKIPLSVPSPGGLCVCVGVWTN